MFHICLYFRQLAGALQTSELVAGKFTVTVATEIMVDGETGTETQFVLTSNDNLGILVYSINKM